MRREAKTQMKAQATKQDFIQGLRAAGCSPSLTQEILDCLERGDPASGVRLLCRHRRRLLDQVHAEQRKVDCLDYLVDKMKRETAWQGT